MIYSSDQKKILKRLLDKYESSKTYRGENFISQIFSIRPSDVLKEYEKDSTDINSIEDFEKQCNSLESDGLVILEWKYERILKITATGTEEAWSKYRIILGVKDKKVRLDEEIKFYSKYIGSEEIVSNFCNEQIERLQNGKESKYKIPDAEKIVELLLFILRNKNEILERELSIAVLHDSKSWEKNYKSKICKILKEEKTNQNLLQGTDEKECNKIILERYNIFDNPTYVYFKGEASVFFSDGNIISVTKGNPIAFSSVSLKNIKKVVVKNSKILTIENLTSFNRFDKKDFFAIYLSGYHNRVKQNFLKLIYEDNKEKKYFHFGDVDPDGFLILENLKTKTDIPFSSYRMSITELKNYSTYTKVLERNDVVKAKGLISKGFYLEEMNYMLDKNCKLEQEIISWMENYGNM